MYAKAGYLAVLGMVLALILLVIFLRMIIIEKRVAIKYGALLDDEAVGNNVSYGTLSSSERNDNDTACGDPEMSPNTDQYLSQQRSSNGDAENVPQAVKDHTLLQSANSTPPHAFPMIRLMKSPRFLAAIYGTFVQVLILTNFDAVLPLYVKETFGWDSLRAGLIFGNLALPALLGPLAGRASDRYGPCRIAIAGCLLATPPLVALRFVVSNTKNQVILLCVLLVLIGAP